MCYLLFQLTFLYVTAQYYGCCFPYTSAHVAFFLGGGLIMDIEDPNDWGGLIIQKSAYYVVCGLIMYGRSCMVNHKYTTHNSYCTCRDVVLATKLILREWLQVKEIFDHIKTGSQAAGTLIINRYSLMRIPSIAFLHVSMTEVGHIIIQVTNYTPSNKENSPRNVLTAQNICR